MRKTAGREPVVDPRAPVEFEELENDGRVDAPDLEETSDVDASQDPDGPLTFQQVEAQHTLTDAEVQDAVDKVLEFCCVATETTLYPYQRLLARRIVESLLTEDAAEITGLFSRQSGKCLAPHTPVLLYDGTVTRADAVRPGDLLMGPDSRPRRVLSTVSGHEPMYRIVPRNKYHEPYEVNESHILTLRSRYDGRLRDVSVRRMLLRSPDQEQYLGVKTAVEYPSRPVTVDPYWLGVWLGDGHSSSTRVTTGDHEIEDMIRAYGQKLGLGVSEYAERGNCRSLAIVKVSGRTNPLWDLMRGLGLDKAKRVPAPYLINDRETRMAVLAGIIDSDGTRPSGAGKSATCEIVSKWEDLARDYVRLAASLGFRASVRPRTISGDVYWRVMLYGELWRVPTRLPRKQWPECRLREDPLAYGFDIVALGEGPFSGFVIDGDRRFLLGDFTITHNTEAVATVATGCTVILPKLAVLEPYCHDDRFRKFAKGFWVGVFAPSRDTAAIMHTRMKLKMRTSAMKEVCDDPEIDLPLPEKGSVFLNMANGSLVSQNTASPQASIEGRTYHLIVCDESQDIDTYVLNKSIHPMGAATSATMVKIGTTNQKPSSFYESCRRNKRHQLEFPEQRDHFEFNYVEVQKWNPRYRKYVAKEAERIGADSEEFRMSYGLEWLMDQGLFINETDFEACAVPRRVCLRRKIGGGYTSFIRYENLVTYDSSQRERRYRDLAAIDIGRNNDSTVITIGRVWWEAPVMVGGRPRHFVHVLNWYEIEGYDHEKQYAMILQFLTNYQLSGVVVDASGRGDPVFDRLKADLELNARQEDKIQVTGFVFNLQTKHQAYALYREELLARRFTYPGGPGAKKVRKHLRFRRQHFDLERKWKGKWMVVAAPERKGRGRDKPKDDYCDSAMLLCWLANDGFCREATNEDDVEGNPFYERESRRPWYAER